MAKSTPADEAARRVCGDLTDHRWMVAKAVMFLVACALCGLLLVLLPMGASGEGGPGVGGGTRLAGVAQVLGVYVLGAWSACRAYYFSFYVITAYCDPQYRYAGVLSAVRWVAGNVARREERT